MRRPTVTTEKFTISGDELVSRVKKLIHEGNIRRVKVIYQGKTVFEIPLTVGASAAVIGIMIAPVLAALGAFAALVTEVTIEVEKVEPGAKKEDTQY
jgi:hypothetical protein